MTDLPETIWAVHGNTEGAVVYGAWADTIRYFCGGIEYRRADLEAPASLFMPLTTAQLMADPRVKALVEALHLMKQTYPYSPLCYGWESQVKAHKSARAALAQLKEPKP